MKARAAAIFTSLLLAFSMLVHAVPPSNTDRKEDSILSVINSSDIDSVKFQNYIKLCDLFNYNDAEKSIEYARKALTLAQETDDPLGIARSYERMASAHFSLGNNKLAEASRLEI